MPSHEELAREWLDGQEAPRRARSDPQDSHGLVYGIAIALVHGFDLGRERGRDLLTAYCGRSDMPWTVAEIEHKISEAMAAPKKHAAGGLARWMLRKKGLRRVWRGEAGGGGAAIAAEPRAAEVGRVPFDLARLRHEVRDVRALVDEQWLRERSPIDPGTCSTEAFLDALYEPGEKVLIFTNFYGQGDYARWVGKGSVRLGRRPGVKGVRSGLPAGGRDGVWFLCQPVSAEWKLNPRSVDKFGRPKMSRRSEEVITAWRYLVLESDEAPQDLWLRYLVKLALPIAAIYTSGGRSVHALVKVDAPSKAWWDQYKRVLQPPLTAMGADPGALSAVRLTRLPGCRRGERMQRLLYLDPQPDAAGVPILWREGRAA